MRRPPQLTQREAEIVPFLASGFSRAEIAQHLDVSEETVKKHTSNILAKFDSLTLREAFYALKNMLNIMRCHPRISGLQQGVGR